MTFQLPVNLIPLPTMPWDVRPDSLPLTVEEVRTALWCNEGNISRAASMLKVDSARLRRYIAASPRLSAEKEEARHQVLDRAEEVMVEALNDSEDAVRRDSMAKFALTNLGKDRGYGNKGIGGVTINNTKGGTIQVSWGDGSSITGSDEEESAGPVIEHHGTSHEEHYDEAAE